jgi:cysteine-rich repeat protein
LSFSNSSAQNVNLTEELPANWNFTSATCTVGGSSIEGGVVAALSPGDVATCSFTNTKSVCGNASEENGEECDDENVTGGDGCSETCQLEACGNAVLDTGEECDDGNTEDGDACTNSCDVAACGDAIVYAGTEECDDGNEINTDACTTSCLLPVCGDGYVQSEEECDDGNENDTDTCSNSCEVVFHVPTCDGQTATVYVRDGKVVGGPNDGNTYNAGHTKLKGTSGPDVIVGTESKDKIEGRDGGDVICGLGGNDDIQGNDGADTIYGGDGKDDINGGNGADVIHGGNGKDDLRGGDGSDALCGGAANDDIRGGNGNDRIDAGSGEDDVRGNDNNDLCVNGEDVHSCESTEGTVEECEDEEVGSSSSSSFSSSEGSSSSFSSSEGGEGSSSSSSEAAACSENDLYAHWTFEEGVGATTDDVVGIHDGNLQNGLGFGAGAPAVDDSTFGLSFDGSDDEVVANSGDTDFSFGNQDFTVSAWTKVASAEDANRSVLGHFDSAEGFKGWGLYFYNTGNVNFFAYGDEGSNDNSFNSPTLLDGGWHNVTGVYKRSGANLVIETYVDGVLIGTTSSMTVGSLAISTPMRLGHYTFQPVFKGGMDDVRVYDRALTSEEITDIYNGCGEEEGGGSSSSEGGGSSSSFASSEEGGGDEEVSASDVVANTDDGTGNGGHHGNRYDSVGAATRFVLQNNAGAAFGAGPDPRVCAAQRLLGVNPSPGIVHYVAGILATELDITQEQIADLLTDPSYCTPLNEAVIRPAKPVAAAKKPVPFYVNADGIPVARGNMVFDLCIAGKPIPLELIRNNPDQIDLDHRGKVKTGASCDEYYLGDGLWKHPDHPEMDPFTFTLKPKKVLSVPAPYVVTTQTFSVGQK